MAQIKVSELSALTATDGNEELLINDGGTSKKVTINNVLHDNSIRAEHYVDGSIATAHIADNAITSAKLGVDVIVAEDIANNAITVAELANNAVTTAKILDDNVTNAKMADDAIDTAQIADSAVETASINNDAVTADKLANSINSAIAANTAKTGISSGQTSAITANTAKVTNATHSGEVTGATALTIADNVVDEANLKVSNSATNGHFLSAQSGASGGMTWAAVDALPSQSGNSGKFLTTDATNASWAVLDTDANTTTKGLYEMKNVISANYSIASGNNAMSAGPITINSNISVTVPSGSTWVIAQEYQMAKVKITGHASGSGIIELTAPNTSTNRTITLPDATGTLLTEVADNAITLAKMASGTDGNIISYDASGNPVAVATGSDGQVLTSTGAGSPPAFETPAGGGKVLQVKSMHTDTGTGSASVDWHATAVTLAITPSATSSKILVSFDGQMYVQNTSGDAGMAIKIQQAIAGGATTSPDALHSRSNVNYSAHYTQQTYGQFNIRIPLSGLVSPNTTSEITYKLYFIPYNVNGAGINSQGGRSTLTLMEIAG